MSQQSPGMTSNRPYLLRAVHEWICDNGMTPFIVVDAAKPGVEVPPQAVTDGRVVLNLAPRAVMRLELGNDVISFMARFGGVSHAVSVPVAAVQAIYARENGQGMLMAEETPAMPSAGTSPDGKAPLQAVPTPAQDPTVADDGDAPPPADSADTDKPRPKGKPSLHVVK